MGQLASAINSHSQENLPSKIEVNPKEHYKAVTLRNGKPLGQVSGETVVGDKNELEHKEVTNPDLMNKVENNQPKPRPSLHHHHQSNLMFLLFLFHRD